MTIHEQIIQDFQEAQKRKVRQNIEPIKLIKGELDRIGKNLTDEEAIKVLNFVRKGAVETYDVVTVALCNVYLPQLLTREDIKSKLLHIIRSKGIQTFPASFGAIMKEWTTQYAGKADNKLVSEVVKEILEGK
ncbi:MAG: GatB/YqeY domain-containing protein [Flavobacterium sp.]